MSISRVRVGLPLDGPRLGGQGGFKWNDNSRSKKPSSSRLNLTRTATVKKAVVEPVEAPVQAVPDIADAPLAFLPFRQFLVLSGLAAVGILLILGMVRSNHKAMTHGYAISELALEKVQLVEKNRQLKTELAQVSSLTELEKVARETLGMITPQEGQIVVID